jgi:leucyl aminopeptidase
MNTKQWNAPWKTYLPKTFDALDKIQVSGLNGTADPMALSIVVAQRKTKKDSLELLSTGVPKDLWNTVKTQAESLSWVSGAPLLLLAGSTQVILASPTTLKVTPTQKGRELGLGVAHLVKQVSPKSVALYSFADVETLSILDGIIQGHYDVSCFKKQVPAQQEEAFAFFKVGLENPPSQDKIQEAIYLAKSLTLTRWLEDAPPNYMIPERLGQIASDLAKDRGIKCTVRGRKEIEALGMGCFASVAGGSDLEPQFITLEIEGEDSSKSMALVGKGLTFDSGGISLKPGPGMEEMKYDMCGGAAVLGAAYYLSFCKPRTKVYALIGAVENMPGRLATRPSDIVVSYNKKTVEILNTDAEGRLVLSDLLAYATAELKPSLVVDIATLTGAVVVALGAFGSAVMTNDQDSADFTLRVGKKTGEPLWQMPLWPELAKEVKSDLADLKNITSPSVKGGTITAGQFLSEFVGETKWVHVDIAGTGWSCKATGYPHSGGSGFGLRLLSQMCLEFEG